MKEQLANMTIIELVKKSHEVASQPLDYYVTPVVITELASRLEALNLVYIGAMNNLRSATSTIERMGVEGAYLLNGAAAELNGSWVRHKTVLGAQAALLCISQGDICAAREWLEGTVDEVGADMPDDMTVSGLQAWFNSQMVAVDGRSGFLTRREAEDAIRARIPATDAFLREQMAQAIRTALDECSDYLETDCVMDRLDISYEDAELRTAGAMELHDALVTVANRLRAGEVV